MGTATGRQPVLDAQRAGAGDGVSADNAEPALGTDGIGHLDALAATFAMNAGTPLRALRIAGEVLASPHADEVAVGWAASAAALSSARTGRFDDVEALARRATGRRPSRSAAGSPAASAGSPPC